jgi:glycosyltransferase involved in cell wall biosynthesis
LDAAAPPDERPLLSVVIPVLNGVDVIGLQLESLSCQTYQGAFEVVVADNGSTDDTVDLVRSWAKRLPWLVVVDASQRRGASHAMNVGAAAARGEYLVFTGADDEVDPGWLKALARATGSCDMMGGHVDTERLNPGPGVPSSPTRAGLPVEQRFLPYPIGSNAGMRASLFHELGGFDNERFPFGAEEIDLFWRAQLRGHRLCWVPDAVVYVRLRATTRQAMGRYYHCAVASCALAATYRSRGAPRDQLSEILRAWGSLVVHTPTLLLSSRRRGWLTHLAARCGYVVGSIRHRVVHLAY